MKTTCSACAIIIASLLPCSAYANCSARIVDSSDVWLPDYNPFSPDDLIVQRQIKLRSFSGFGCRYRVYFRRNPTAGSFSNRLNYELTDNSNRPLLMDTIQGTNANYLLSAPMYGESEQTITYLFHIERGQIVPPGHITDQVEMLLYDNYSQILFDRDNLNAAIEVDAVAMVNLAGGGLFTSINFGRLQSGASRSLILEARSNTDYHIVIESANQGQLRLNPPVGSQNWSISYSLSVDDTALDLSHEQSLDAGVPEAGERTHSLNFQIKDASNKRAGIYKDVITANIYTSY